MQGLAIALGVVGVFCLIGYCECSSCKHVAMTCIYVLLCNVRNVLHFLSIPAYTLFIALVIILGYALIKAKRVGGHSKVHKTSSGGHGEAETSMTADDGEGYVMRNLTTANETMRVEFS